MECISGVGKKKCLNYIYEEMKGKEKENANTSKEPIYKILVIQKKNLKKEKFEREKDCLNDCLIVLLKDRGRCL